MDHSYKIGYIKIGWSYFNKYLLNVKVYAFNQCWSSQIISKIQSVYFYWCVRQSRLGLGLGANTIRSSHTKNIIYLYKFVSKMSVLNLENGSGTWVKRKININICLKTLRYPSVIHFMFVRKNNNNFRNH